MAIEDAFMGARIALILFDVYVNMVAQEIGKKEPLL